MPRTWLLVVLVAFCGLDGVSAVNQCSTGPYTSVGTSVLLTDPDGNQNAIQTSKADGGCAWNVTCGQADGDTSLYAFTLVVEGLRTWASVRFIDGEGATKQSYGGFATTGHVIRARVDSWTVPMTVRTGFSGPFDVFAGYRITVGCLRAFGTEGSDVTNRTVMIRERSVLEAFAFSIREFQIPVATGESSGVGSIEYALECPEPHQQIEVRFEGVNESLSSVHGRASPATSWATLSDRSSAYRLGAGVFFVRFRSDTSRYAVADITAKCTNDRYFECLAHQPPGGEQGRVADIMLPSQEDPRDGRITAEVRTDWDGDGANRGRIGAECHVSVRCDDPQYNVVLDWFRMSSGKELSFTFTGPEGLRRATFGYGRHWQYGQYFIGQTMFPVQYVQFAAADEKDMPLLGVRGAGNEVRPVDNGVLFSYTQRAHVLGTVAPGEGAWMRYSCRKRRVDRRPGHDLRAIHLRRQRELAADAPLDPDVVARAPAPLGVEHRFWFQSVTGRELDTFTRRGVTLWNPLDVSVIRVPLSCGPAANIDVRLLQSPPSGYDLTKTFNTPHSAETDLLRIVGNGRLGQITERMDHFSTAERLVGSPAEIQFVTTLPRYSGGSWKNAHTIKNLSFAMSCTLDGRNGPPWPETAPENLPIHYPGEDPVVSWSLRAERSNPYSPPVPEAMGQLDAISSDRDGVRAPVKTYFGVNVTIACPRRYSTCKICTQSLNAKLISSMRLMAYHGASGALIADLLRTGVGAIDTDGETLPLSVCGDGGLVVTLLRRRGTTEAVNGFTLTFFADTRGATVLPWSATLSQTLPPVPTRTTSRTASGASLTSSATRAGNSPTRQYTPSPTPGPTGSATATASVSMLLSLSRVASPTRSASLIPRPRPPAPVSAVEEARAVTTPVAAGAVAAAGALGVGAPASATQPSRLQAAAAVITCGDDLDDVEVFAHPLAWLVLPMGNDPAAPEEEESLLLAYASAVVTTAALTVLIVAAPVVILTAKGDSPRVTGSQVYGLIVGLAVAYFGPNVVEAAAPLLYRGVYMAQAVASLVVVPCLVSAAVGVFTMKDLREERGRLSTEKRRRTLRTAFVEGMSGGTRTDIDVHTTVSWRWWCIRLYYYIDVVGASLLSLVSGFRPTGAGSRTVCLTIAVLALLIAIAFAAFMTVLRPMANPIEGGFAIVIAYGQVALAVVGLLYVTLREPILLELFEPMALGMTVLLLLQTIALLVQYCTGYMNHFRPEMKRAIAEANARLEEQKERMRARLANPGSQGNGDSASGDANAAPLLDPVIDMVRRHEEEKARQLEVQQAPMRFTANLIDGWHDDSPAMNNPLALRAGLRGDPAPEDDIPGE